MWYAIFLSAGLSVGLGLMIWALIERSKRAKAEQQVNDERNYRKAAEDSAAVNLKTAEILKQKLDEANAHLDRMYGEVEKMKALLVKYGQTEAIQQWLKDELKGWK